VGLRIDVRVDPERDRRAGPIRRATIETRASSAALSTLSVRMPASSAKAISSSRFPTPL